MKGLISCLESSSGSPGTPKLLHAAHLALAQVCWEEKETNAEHYNHKPQLLTGAGRSPGNAGKQRWPAAEGRAEQGSPTLEPFLFGSSWCFSIPASGFRGSAREGQYGAILWHVLLGYVGASSGKHALAQVHHAPWVQIICSSAVRLSLLTALSSCPHISFEEEAEGVEACELSRSFLLRQGQAVAKPRQPAEPQPREHAMGLVALWSSAGTGGA